MQVGDKVIAMRDYPPFNIEMGGLYIVNSIHTLAFPVSERWGGSITQYISLYNIKNCKAFPSFSFKVANTVEDQERCLTQLVSEKLTGTLKYFNLTQYQYEDYLMDCYDSRS